MMSNIKTKTDKDIKPSLIPLVRADNITNNGFIKGYPNTHVADNETANKGGITKPYNELHKLQAEHSRYQDITYNNDKQNKNKSKRTLLGITLTTTFLITVLSLNTSVKATTVDDLRELSNQPRLSEKYTDKDIAEISSRYKSLSDNNKLAKYFDLDEVRKENKRIKKSLKEQENRVNTKVDELKTTYSKDVLPDKTLGILEELKEEQRKLNNLERPKTELSVKYKKNTYEKAYKDVLATVAELEGYKDIGYIGKEMKSPVITKLNFERYQVKQPFGYRHDVKNGKVIKSVILNKGIDLGTVKSDSIKNMWSGTVENIINHNDDRVEVQIRTHKNLLVTYKGVRQGTVKVYKGEKVGQYKSLGKATGKPLHIEVILDQQAVNPIYFMGTSRLETLRNYIELHTDDNLVVKMRNLLPLVKDGTKARLAYLEKNEKKEAKLRAKGYYRVNRGKEEKKVEQGEIEVLLAEGYEQPMPKSGVAKMYDNSDQASSDGKVKERGIKDSNSALEEALTTEQKDKGGE